ncbi:response regulator transcription factor [Pseudoduganella violacea]|uniref:RNA polymerase sigma factor (Sigma-70 family) n=1 Tax=Pseudoduganella violacea TaxID=1715466 RepID=A0A7W5BAH1_9BURK|nr:response regulator [Pseudoduganella violacea]MBB3119514.1 RNA polymerase sigma factor (sigma-70 family) [Pseudoduganella violacea]
MNSPQRVFLVDDQPEILKALGRLLRATGFEVDSYLSAQAFLDSGNADAAGCLVLDLSMPGMNGLDLLDALRQRPSLLPAIFLTGQGDLDAGIRAMKLGAADFLTKPVDDARLIGAIEHAFADNRRARGAAQERHSIQQRLDSLTPREREVMALLVEGLLNKQIGAELGMVEKTVKVHRARIMQKMQVRSLTALVRLVDRVQPTHPA